MEAMWSPPLAERLPDPLARRAAAAPADPALIMPGRSWSWAELEAAAARAAGRLAALGLGPGDRLALLARNGPGFAALLHAAPRLGLVLVPLNLRLAPAELAWQLADCGATLLAHDEALAELAAAAAGDLPRAEIAALIDAAGAAGAGGAEAIPLGAPHTIIYTSGTTGRPKGAVLTYGNHWWSAAASALNLGLHHDDRWLAALPLFHVGGLAILLRSAFYGIPAVLHERFDPHAVNAAIERDRVTIISVVAAMLQAMLDARGDAPYPAHLRCVLLGGGPAPRPLLERCAAIGLPVVQTYGMTETASQAVTLAPAEALRRLGSAGRPLLPVELRIDAAGPGEVGEILLRGPNVMAGYHGRPEASAAALRGGWLHTGDLGYLDGEGYLYVVDRRSDLIISGGENIYPAEVEAALLAHPAVVEAGVVGVADERWGQVPVAAVVPRGELDPDELLAWARGRLAGYKLPRRVVVLAELPRTAAGKLQRARLRELLG